MSSVPSADFSSLNTVLNIVSNKVNEWGARINCSRMGAEKKDRGLQIINSIKLAILNFNSDTQVLGSDKEHSRYETANYIKQKLDVLSDNVPVACKNNVCEVFRKLGIELNKVSRVESDRHFILSCVAEKVVENSEKYRVDVQKENISKGSLTISDIENTKDSDYLDAAGVYAYEKFGKGASSVVRGIFYAHKNNYKYVTMDWPFPEEMENIISCAKSLGVKEFAFQGDCTSTLRNLNLITKLGYSFRIEEVEYKRYGDTEIIPVAVVTI